ncbi:MAG: LAGLIDADG family homing endonuclease [Candidatus Jorgensenbacteria bacterium]
MRVKLTQEDLDSLFKNVLGRTTTLAMLARTLNFSVRAVGDWQKGKYTLPLRVFKNLLSFAEINESVFTPVYFDDFWNVKRAARAGGIARIKLHGDPGTPEGRRKGGLASIAVHRKNGGRFKTLKRVKALIRSAKLAEFIGILFGDGHLSEFQVSISTNSKTDGEHAQFIKKSIKNLFGVSATIRKKRGENTVIIVASSKNLVRILNGLGMPIGNKIIQQLTIPKWIFQNNAYQQAFLRGLFDTDGSVYLDVHRRKKRIYAYMGWTITSYADTLISGILELLKGMGFSPTHEPTQKSVFLRRQKEIIRYFKEIGTSNPKHAGRFKKFSGGVPKWS